MWLGHGGDGPASGAVSGFSARDLPEGLVERAAAGDSAAQAQLYETYAGAVYTLARRVTGRPAIAEEILQETFVEVLEKLRGLRDAAAVGGWIRTIALNKALMHLRSNRWLEAVDATLVAAPPDPLPLDLERLLQQLPGMARLVVWLHDVEGYTHEEIGRLLGRTTSFSKSQLARAYQRLRRLTRQHDGAEEPTCMPLSSS